MAFYDQHRCATALYLLSMLAHVYIIIICCGIGAPRYGIEVVDGLNEKILSHLTLSLIEVLRVDYKITITGNYL